MGFLKNLLYYFLVAVVVLMVLLLIQPNYGNRTLANAFAENWRNPTAENSARYEAEGQKMFEARAAFNRKVGLVLVAALFGIYFLRRAINRERAAQLALQGLKPGSHAIDSPG